MFQCIFASMVLRATCLFFFLAGVISSGITHILKENAIWSWKEEKQKLTPPAIGSLAWKYQGGVGLSSLVVPDKQGIFPKNLANESRVTRGWGLTCAGPQTCWHLKVFCPWLVSFATSKMKLLMLYLPSEVNAWKTPVVWKLCSLWWGKSWETPSQCLWY